MSTVESIATRLVIEWMKGMTETLRRSYSNEIDEWKKQGNHGPIPLYEQWVMNKHLLSALDSDYIATRFGIDQQQFGIICESACWQSEGIIAATCNKHPKVSQEQYGVFGKSVATVVILQPINYAR